MEINSYGRQLSDVQIQAGVHRDLVGGLWDELGVLQFDYLVKRGLKRHHRLLDVGCGALRGGVHFVRYLDAGCYYGMDSNASLVKAGCLELKQAGIESKSPRLLVDDRFEVSRFSTRFDYALALSLFTHLPMNHIVRCLSKVANSLRADGRFFATIFEAPSRAYLESLTHSPGGIVTHYDNDPYHQSIDEMQWLAAASGMRLVESNEWGHPRGQKMLTFVPETA